MSMNPLAGLIAATFLGQSPVPTTQAGPDRSWVAAVRQSGVAGPAVPNLPDARGREFRTLDEYLAHLRAYAAPVDRPWFRTIRPGVYRRETGNFRGLAPRRLFTRDQLERRFGFRR